MKDTVIKVEGISKLYRLGLGRKWRHQRTRLDRRHCSGHEDRLHRGGVHRRRDLFVGVDIVPLAFASRTLTVPVYFLTVDRADFNRTRPIIPIAASKKIKVLGSGTVEGCNV